MSLFKLQRAWKNIRPAWKHLFNKEYSDNQKKMEKEKVILALLSCIRYCNIANSLT